jgi:hypothetical protein
MAYGEVSEQRAQRDQMVEQLMSQLRTLEETARQEEERAEAETRRAARLEKEKALAQEKLRGVKDELDTAYTRLAATNDQLAEESEAHAGLTHTVQSLAAWRAAKDAQVATLVKEKTRLFRLVTDLRSTLKTAKAGQTSDDQLSSPPLSPARSSASAPRPASAVRASRASIGHMIGATLAGTHGRPAWSAHRRLSDAPGVLGKTTGAAAVPLSHPSTLDSMAFNGSVTNLALRSASARTSPSRRNPTSLTESSGAFDFSASANGIGNGNPSASPSTDGTSRHTGTSPGRRRRRLTADDSSEEEEEGGVVMAAASPPADMYDAIELDAETAVAQARADHASVERRMEVSQQLVKRLQKQIASLEEKNKEQEKVVQQVRAENAQLLIRFRGAHERRMQAEKRTKQVEAELALIRGRQGTVQLQSAAAHALMEPLKLEYETTNPSAHGSQQSSARGRTAAAANARWKS